MIFQDPFASLNPRLRVSEIVGEAPRVHGLVARNRQAEYVAETLLQVGLDPDLCEPLPAPVLRRPAPAGRHRPRPGGEARLHRVRRGGGGARRLDPGAGAEPAHGTAPAGSASPCSSATTLRSSSISRLGSRSCISAGLVEVGPADELFARPRHPYTQALLAEVPQARGPPAPLQADRRRAALTARPAVRLRPSTRAARTPSPAARPSAPRFARWRRATRSACHLNDR